MYYYPSASSRAATILVGQVDNLQADCQSAFRLRLAANAGQAGSRRGGWLPPLSGASAAVDRLTIGRSLPSCPTKAPVATFLSRTLLDRGPQQPIP
jgi:hypothetical protein